MANNWTRAETILAFNLYCKIPFGRIDQRNPEIIALANRLGRTSGRSHTSLQTSRVWTPPFGNETYRVLPTAAKWTRKFGTSSKMIRDALAYESELLTSQPQREWADEIIDFPEGGMRESLVKTRINQQFFRTAVLAAYEGQCLITGLAVRELLCASHIVPWRTDTKNRTNPAMESA